MNRCIRDPYVQWCERRTPLVNSSGAVYSIIGWRSCLSWVTTILCRSFVSFVECFFVWLVCRVFYFFLKRWKFFKNNFSFGLALQALLKTLVVCWLVRFLIVLANCVGFTPTLWLHILFLSNQIQGQFLLLRQSLVRIICKLNCQFLALNMRWFYYWF